MARYFTQSGSHPEIQGVFYVSGPQDEGQIMQEVKTILDRPGIKSVVITYDHGLGERLDVFQKIPEG